MDYSTLTMVLCVTLKTPHENEWEPKRVNERKMLGSLTVHTSSQKALRCFGNQSRHSVLSQSTNQSSLKSSLNQPTIITLGHTKITKLNQKSLMIHANQHDLTQGLTQGSNKRIALSSTQPESESTQEVHTYCQRSFATNMKSLTVHITT